ncbi:hypothetical protein PICSAR110_04554 [Mycobacterium avium subsp. paratuberculosis]|nr:hypothetical protein PICSAR102_02649 [Mycobacterium avium subsp. paratuberculosis]CAG6906939.1 hypothetical protein PICSAR126_02746 [Mycobacterium avium subsp. paratuberculosis]CAG6937102.1 hypothetical protein PICSAR110_04554 [Mycobacterium avium subsp. paratuberculosis]CAG6982465.1 hypothetical protein PICSAR14_02368 [Mycobacterium avium subsp. paratuberculosis]CAG6983675.1 hypothetical protein PICSAR154_02424 [Mycobacterium avium subsp. paratuberculosis]
MGAQPGLGLGTTPGLLGASGAGLAGAGTAGCGAGALLGAWTTPPWNPALGASAGGGGSGACCWLGRIGMNLPGVPFCTPTTGCRLAVGSTATAIAVASDANPMTAKAMTALPITNDRRDSLAGAASSPSS